MMRKSRIPRRGCPDAANETPGQRFFRLALIVLLFGAAAFGFWLNSERNLHRLKSSPPAAEQPLKQFQR